MDDQSAYSWNLQDGQFSDAEEDESKPKKIVTELKKEDTTSLSALNGDAKVEEVLDENLNKPKDDEETFQSKVQKYLQKRKKNIVTTPKPIVEAKSPPQTPSKPTETSSIYPHFTQQTTPSPSKLAKMKSSSVRATIEDFPELCQEFDPRQRYEVVVMVISKAWIKNGKVSVWVEDPTDHGITIMCSFARSWCEKLLTDGFLDINCQYQISCGMINEYFTENVTFAPLQLLLDKFSTIDRVKENARLEIVYRPLECLLEIGENADEDSKGTFLDIIGIPIEDNEEKSENRPRKIMMIDDSGGEIIWLLWGNDRFKDEAINALMKKPVLIRNGKVSYFNGDWQVSKELCAVRFDPCLPRMMQLKSWFDNDITEID